MEELDHKRNQRRMKTQNHLKKEKLRLLKTVFKMMMTMTRRKEKKESKEILISKMQSPSLLKKRLKTCKS